MLFRNGGYDKGGMEVHKGLSQRRKLGVAPSDFQVLVGVRSSS
jgi:hypothetical protein